MNSNRKFCCSDTMCTAFFDSEESQLLHEQQGTHEYVRAKTSMDKIREYYVEQKTIDRTFYDNPSSLTAVIPESVNPKDFNMKYFKGWAKPTKKYKRFTEKQKDFIKCLFDEGEKQKKKLNTETMATRM